MTQRHIRKAERSRELDRDTWADLDVIEYRFEVVGDGEAIAGPFYFGRAFDAPPIFTFSAALKSGSSATAPQITVGVAEWIRHEEGVYVGANLWVKISENCFDPPSKEGVVLFDDIEDLLAKQGGGPEGDEIPYVGVTRFDVSPGSDPDTSFNYKELFWPSQYPETFPDRVPFDSKEPGDRTAPYRWVQDMDDNVRRESEGPSLVQDWKITDEVSRSGQHSLFCPALPEPEHILPLHQSWSHDLLSVNILACQTFPEREYEEGSSFFTNRPYIWGWRCDGGTEVKISFYRMHDWVDTPLGSWAALIWSLSFYGVNPGFETPSTLLADPDEFGLLGGGSWRFWLDPGQDSGEGLVANEWHYRELSDGFPTETSNTWIAPPGTRYVKIYFSVFQYDQEPVFNITQLPRFKTWVDDIKIEFVGPQAPQRKPEFDVAVKFGGNALKGYAAVHPLRSYEAPTRVELS